MKLTDDELNQIANRLCNLATECHFMYDEANVASRLVGCYCNSSYQVICRLQDVLRRANHLLDDLHCVEVTLDSFLVSERIFQDSEV